MVTNKQEVCDWLLKYRLSSTDVIYDRLIKRDLGDLDRLQSADHAVLEAIVAGMNVIEKKKFQKAIRELRSGSRESLDPSLSDTITSASSRREEDLSTKTIEKLKSFLSDTLLVTRVAIISVCVILVVLGRVESVM